MHRLVGGSLAVETYTVSDYCWDGAIWKLEFLPFTIFIHWKLIDSIVEITDIAVTPNTPLLIVYQLGSIVTSSIVTADLAQLSLSLSLSLRLVAAKKCREVKNLDLHIAVCQLWPHVIKKTSNTSRQYSCGHHDRLHRRSFHQVSQVPDQEAQLKTMRNHS